MFVTYITEKNILVVVIFTQIWNKIRYGYYMHNFTYIRPYMFYISGIKLVKLC